MIQIFTDIVLIEEGYNATKEAETHWEVYVFIAVVQSEAAATDTHNFFECV